MDVSLHQSVNQSLLFVKIFLTLVFFFISVRGRKKTKRRERERARRAVSFKIYLSNTNSISSLAAEILEKKAAQLDQEY